MKRDRMSPASKDPARRTLPTLVLVLVSLLVLPAPPAAAHPYVVGGGRMPVQSLASIELDLAHGCGDEQIGAGRDTDEVMLEAPNWLRVIDVPGPEGWEVSVESLDDGRRVVTWTATTGALPAPRFRLDVVADGDAGETRFLRVSQRCGEIVERWIGTADEPAALPAVRVLLTEQDLSSPPPALRVDPPGPEDAESAEDTDQNTTERDARSAETSPPLLVATPTGVAEDPLRRSPSGVLLVLTAATLSVMAVLVARRVRRRAPRESGRDRA